MIHPLALYGSTVLTGLLFLGILFTFEDMLK